MLSPTKGQVAYALLTRLPLGIFSEKNSLVRLACVKHAASVRPEPGSNSPLNEEPCFGSFYLWFKRIASCSFKLLFGTFVPYHELIY